MSKDGRLNDLMKLLDDLCYGQTDEQYIQAGKKLDSLRKFLRRGSNGENDLTGLIAAEKRELRDARPSRPTMSPRIGWAAMYPRAARSPSPSRDRRARVRPSLTERPPLVLMVNFEFMQPKIESDPDRKFEKHYGTQQGYPQHGQRLRVTDSSFPEKSKSLVSSDFPMAF